MIAFVREVSDNCKRTKEIKEAISRSWVPGTPTYRCPDYKGNTVLHVAARMGEAKFVSVVGHVFPDINIVNGDGDTALHLAAEYDHKHVIETLLKHKADYNRLNALNFT